MESSTPTAAPPPPAVPSTMRALVAPRFCKPDGYEVMDMPVPAIEKPDEIFIKVHAACLMTGDTMVASGMAKFIFMTEVPIKLGIVCSGTIVAVGSGVKSLRPGDAVVGAAFGRPMDYRRPPGFCAEYCVGRESLFVTKPPNVSFEDTVGLFGVTMTAYQSAELARRMYREERQRLRKEGKTATKPNAGDEDEDLFRDRDVTVFVPAALSSTGFAAIQLFKNVYGAKRIVSTVSTAKMPLVEQHLPGQVDTLIDYTKTPDMTAAVGAGTIDLAYNTQLATLGSIPPLMRRGDGTTSVVVSIASMFPSKLLREVLGADVGHVRIPFFLYWLVDLVVWYDRYWRFGRAIREGVVFDVLSGSFGTHEDLERTVEIIGSEKVRGVKTLVGLEDIDAIRAACNKVAKGKGGIGALVVKIV